MSGTADRYAELRAIARARGFDAVALVPGPNFQRLYDKDFHTSERPLVVLVPPEGPPAAVVPNLELGSFALIGFEGAVFDWRDQVGHGGAFAALAAAMPLRRIGVEGQVMRVFVHHALMAVYPSLEIVDAERAISGLRLRKRADEIAALEAAIAVSETALARTLEAVRVGMTEMEVQSILLGALFAAGAEDLSFGPIVAAGDNSARPHASARPDYRIRRGDALLLDFGARVGGLCADITRTVFVGEADAEARAVYDTVLRANAAGHAATRPGATAHDVDDAATAVLEASPFAARIRTKTGHGLGRAVHEEPYIMRGNAQILEPGMVFTIEPGLYEIGRFGVRIEDDVLVTETGTRSLTAFPRDLMIIG
jgi:Xaa-Pro dipeptidase